MNDFQEDEIIMTKYYGTMAILRGKRLVKVRDSGSDLNRQQFYIVCKAKSKAEANRRCNGIFDPACTSETHNAAAIEAADKYGSAIEIRQGKYISYENM